MPQGLLHLHHVPFPQRTEDRPVQIRGPLLVCTGRRKRDVRSGEGLKGAPDTLQGAVVSKLHDAGVEGRVADGNLVSVPKLGGRLHRLMEFLNLRKVRVGHGRDAKPHGQRLELGPDCVSLEQFGCGGPADPRAAEWKDLHHTKGLKTPEGLTHRRLAGPNLLGDPRLHNPGIWRIPTGQNVLQEAVFHLVCENAALDRGVGGHGGLLGVGCSEF